MKSQPKSARPHRGDPIFGRLRRCFSLTMRRHCIARRASQPPQTWGLQMVTLFLSGPKATQSIIHESATSDIRVAAS